MAEKKTQELLLNEALATLEVERERHAEAALRCEAARREETAAVNRLNDAQKAVDAAYRALRDTAAWGSGWHSDRRRRAEEVS